MGFTYARVGFLNVIGNSFSLDFSVEVSSFCATTSYALFTILSMCGWLIVPSHVVFWVGRWLIVAVSGWL